ncbi:MULTISPECIES: T6SS effector phospholipase Tle3 domain-containing protein [Burkholderia]|nr:MULTISPECIES: hypothetical protein [Burkholderia]AQQ44192.1 hypothetical protein A8E75_19795 [Burkholderia cenocepacia]MBG0878662.1 hypothetical protein [Burkholderia sp. 9775_39]MBG0884233.1 hypothetical protein [Burkholderia sp. 9773_38]ONV17358.1 hypothetical protein A8E74_26420 [Burkholderia cenocepacia]ONV21165.1 hypothetical protein A8E78_34165 [Burkholderia cenocepacia]
MVGESQGPMLFDMQNELICVKQPPLPGVIIFVHGVNSEGEWYEGAEKGLCKGLNRRLARLDDQLDHKGVICGQMSPVAYTESLTPDGFLNPKLWAGNYIKPDPSFSPVIHFRWGYKANKEELKEYGDKIFLNEKNYWGGGPFANGCSSLPDLWHEGLDDRIFGWISVQAMNPTTRPLYRTPPRTYGVLAALRLAKLVESIRRKQANVPITIVCHSQGNMVGLTAAFFGDQLTEVTDPWGNKGRCVADAYVLANPPYSVANTNTGMDTWSQRDIKDHKNGRGRETYEARTKTLRAFLDIIRARSAFEPPADKVDREMGNCRTAEQGKPYSADADRNTHGLNGHTYGRVTLYCCPHDQVISAVTVQGIGWRGLGRIKDATKEDGPSKELIDIGADGVLTQRVFATHWEVGKVGDYSYWTNDWRYGKKGTTPGFWFPPSPPAKFGLVRAWSGNENPIAKLFTTASAPVLYLVTMVTSGFKLFPVNADPPEFWTVNADAPALDEPFTPKTYRSNDPEHLNPIKIRDGEAESDFNDGYDTPASARNAAKTDKQSDDPYDTYQSQSPDDLPNGDVGSEASQRYEDRAILRMRARRDGRKAWVDDEGNVMGEDGKSDVPEGYQQWHNEQVVEILDAGKLNNPTNHSTTMTNPEHAQKALAYDVAVGLCYLSPQDFAELRIEADWRFGSALPDIHPSKGYAQYFESGVMGKDGAPVHEWVKIAEEAKRPEKIVDERENELYLKIGGAV